MINEKRVMARRFGTRQITVIGMLSSISIILGATRLGFIPIPPATATIMHLPVIIGAILEGPAVGAMIGLIFGVFSIIQAVTAPNILSFAFINPMVSVLPRVLIGITSYYIYKAVFVKNEALKIGIGAAIGSITNTVGVLGMIYLLYVTRFAEVKGISSAAAAKTIFGIAVVNGLPEAALAVLITIPVVLAINKIRKLR